jgi:PAS domain S-box-containing protein
MDRLNQLTSLIPGVVYQFLVKPDGEWAFVYISPGVRILFELSPDEAYADQNAMTQCILEEDRAGHRASVELASRTLTMWMHEHRIRPRSGRIKWVRGQATPELQPDGSVLWNGFLIDITDHRQAEDALREKEALYRAVADHGQALIWMAGLDKGCYYFNAPWLAFTGRTLEQEQGNGWVAGVHPDDLQRCLEIYVAAFDRREKFSMEYRLRRHDGTYRWILDEGTPRYGSSGEFVGYVGHCLDINERKQSEAELERHRNDLEALVQERTAALSVAKEAAEAANRAKTTFLATMSHELRTPMNGIMGMNMLAMRRNADPIVADYLKKVAQSSERLLSLINDILDMSQIEAERLTLQAGDFRLGEILERVASSVRKRAQDKHLAFAVEVDGDLGAIELHSDHLRLCQILVNLVSNAVKFTEKGSVALRARLMEDSPTYVHVRFEVADTGIGISAEEKRRIFAPFEQADGSPTRKYGGAGLGLALCQKLARAMGGDIGVESQVGAGSVFWLTLRLFKVD